MRHASIALTLAFALALVTATAVSAATTTSSSRASSSRASDAYQPGHWVASAGLGFGVAGVYGTSGMPLISLAAEYGLNDKVSVGGSVGHTSSSDDFGYYYGKYTYGYTIVAARGSYHFGDQLKIEKLDAYAGVSLGYAVVSSSFSRGYYTDYYRSPSASYLAYGIHGGARYWFSPKFAGFGELGFGLGNIVLGASTRF
jgi:hypothetical protein